MTTTRPAGAEATPQTSTTGSSATGSVPPPSLPTASPRETAQVLGGALGPILAQGVIARRPWVVKVAGQLGTDDRGVALLQGLRDRHGSGPVRLPIPGRPAALVLGAPDVRRVLEGTPEPFAPASWEKRGALGHFQPRGVVVSHGAARDECRRFTETVLETGSPMHSHAAAITRVVREEAVALRAAAAGLDHAGHPARGAPPRAAAPGAVRRRDALPRGLDPYSLRFGVGHSTPAEG